MTYAKLLIRPVLAGRLAFRRTLLERKAYHSRFLMRSGGGGRRGFCSAQSKAGEAATEGAESSQGLSMGKKVGLFSAFLAVGGGATFAYMLVTDADFLFKVRDVSPGLVNAVAPWIGLPVEEETGELDVEEYMPRDIQDIVGTDLKVACTLRSGRVCLVDASANAGMEELQALVAAQLGETAVEIVQVDFVNEDEVAAIEAIDEEALQKSFGINVPEIPAGASKKELRDLLDQCRLLQADLHVQVELSKKYNNDTSQILRAIDETEERKKEIKRLLRRRF